MFSMQPDNNPYDFFMGGGPPQKQSFASGAGSSIKKRIMIVAIGGAIFILIIIIAFSLLFGGKGSGVETLLSIAKQQTELIRIAEAGSTKARGTVAQNLAITTKLSVSTSQQELLAYMKKQGLTADPKELLPVKNAKTDEALTAAEQNNRYDETFTQIIKEELTKYQAAIKKAHTETTSQTGKQILTGAFDHAGILLNEPTAQASGASPSSP